MALTPTGSNKCAMTDHTRLRVKSGDQALLLLTC